MRQLFSRQPVVALLVGTALLSGCHAGSPYRTTLAPNAASQAPVSAEPPLAIVDPAPYGMRAAGSLLPPANSNPTPIANNIPPPHPSSNPIPEPAPVGLHMRKLNTLPPSVPSAGGASRDDLSLRARLGAPLALKQEIKQTPPRAVPVPPPPTKPLASPATQPSFTHAPDYRWISGQAIKWRNEWRLRYALVDQVDPYGGSVLLAGEKHLASLKDGEHYTLHGRLVLHEGHTADPTFIIETVQPLKR